MADNLNLQNSSVSADQPLGGSSGPNGSLTPAPAKSPLEESGVEPAPAVSDSPLPPEQPTPSVPAVEPEVAAPDILTAQDNVVTPSAMPIPEPITSPTPSMTTAPLTGDVLPADTVLSNPSPIPAGAPDPTKIPDAMVEPTMPTEPIAEPSDSLSVPAPSVDVVTTPDSGEPSEAPDTDEFLQSILDNKSQSQPIDESVGASAEALVSQSASIDVPIKAPDVESTAQPAASEISPEIVTPPSSSGSPFTVPTAAEAAPALTELATDPTGSTPASQEQLVSPTTSPPEPATSADLSQSLSSDDQGPTATTQSNITDSLSSASSPAIDSPDQSVASDIFSKKSSQGKSPVKLIVLVLLVAVVLGGIYFGAKTFFFPVDTSSTAEGGLGATTPSPTVALTGDAARKADLRAIQQALLNLYSANGKYPVAADYIKLSQAGNVVEKELVPNYLSKLPADTDSARAYQYKSDGTTFTLTAALDNKSDAGVSMENGVALYKVDQSTDVATTTGSSTGVSSDTSVQTSSGSASADSSGINAATNSSGVTDGSISHSTAVDTSLDTSSDLF